MTRQVKPVDLFIGCVYYFDGSGDGLVMSITHDRNMYGILWDDGSFSVLGPKFIVAYGVKIL